MKRLVIYFDGTWSLPSARTNVHRLCELTRDQDEAGVQQVKEYWSGVGTKWLEWLRGGVLGFGTGRNIGQAYAWLKDRYQDGDEVFILGFSRGAYSARSLAGMIARCGLLRSDANTTVEEIYRRYAVKNEELVADSRRIPIHFLGVWDTVGALGVPWGNFPGVSRSTTLFHNTSPNPLYRNMFHALASNENRAAFEPTLWTDEDGFTLQPNQQIEQCWFLGSHSDVGGGSGREGGLPRIALVWMQQHASQCGLAFTEQIEEDTAGDHRSRVGDSFASFLLGAYRLTRLNRRYHRPIGQATMRTPTGTGRPLNETIHESVFRRWQYDDSYRQASPNLQGWADRRGLDLTTVQGTTSARATTP